MNAHVRVRVMYLVGPILALAWVAAAEPASTAPAKDAPPPVKDVKVFHRAGQTFITWTEPAPLIDTEAVTWGQIKEKLAAAKDACIFRVCAADKPITAATLAQAQLVGQADAVSAYNCNGRSTDYVIGQAMIKQDVLGELAQNNNGFIHTWTMDHPRLDRCPISRFVIDERAGVLPVGSGLYVHGPTAAGKRYYAVVSCRNGVENTKDIWPANAPQQPVDETVGAGEPVCQGPGLWGPFFDYPGTRKNYVQWANPPLSPRPMYFNWSVMTPPSLNGQAKGEAAPSPVPLELYFPGRNYSYAQPNLKLLQNSIQIATQDYPFSAWYGYNDAIGTSKNLKDGVVSNHTQRRIMAFVEWAKRRLPVDGERVLAVGGDGAAALALAYPDAFAYVLVNDFDSTVLNPKAEEMLSAAWGPKSPDIKDDKGRSDWSWAMLDELVKSVKGDLPLLVCKGASWGRASIAFGKGQGRFYKAMLDARQPLLADWSWASGILIIPDKWTGQWCGLGLTRTTPVPAFANSSLDGDRESLGTHNVPFKWKDVKDSADGFEITIQAGRGAAATVDLTPRRCQKFKPAPNEKLKWEATAAPAEKIPNVKPATLPAPQSGEVSADANGLATLKQLDVPPSGLMVKISRK